MRAPALDSLSAGTIDVMQTLRQGTIRDARNAGGFTLYEHQGNDTGGGMYNTALAPFDDVRVRNALTMMNNQEAVIGALGGEGISNGTTQWFGSDSPYWSQAAADAWPTFVLRRWQSQASGIPRRSSPFRRQSRRRERSMST